MHKELVQLAKKAEINVKEEVIEELIDPHCVAFASKELEDLDRESLAFIARDRATYVWEVLLPNPHCYKTKFKWYSWLKMRKKKKNLWMCMLSSLMRNMIPCSVKGNPKSVLRCVRPRLHILAPSCHVVPFRLQMDTSRPVERSIRTKLSQALSPEHLEVLNESHQHAVPPGSESHFRVLVVSQHFEGLSLLQRHRLVNEVLQEELSTCVHALAIQAKTPQQWQGDPTVAKSPPCMGGSKHDISMEGKLKAGRDRAEQD
ncbi:bolA-like protein 1-like [Arapaima gigas]